MKKFVALLLSVLMIVSSLGFTAFASDSNNVDQLGTADFNAESFIKNGDLSSVKVLGLSLDFLYNSKTSLIWLKNTAEDGEPSNGIDVSKNDLAVMIGNLNSYLKRILNNAIGGTKLYTREYAAKIINIIGNLISPNFTDVKPENLNITFENEGTNDFYRIVVDRSGLDRVIQYNWCNQTCNFKPLMTTLGVSFENILLESEYSDGQLMAEMLVKAVISKILERGPLDYFLDTFLKFSKVYKAEYYDAVKALFKGQITGGVITEDELMNLKGLFNLVANGNNPDDTEHLHFATMPTYRFSVSADTTELALYFMAYLALIGQDADNAWPIELMKRNVSNSKILTDEDKSRFITLINSFICGKEVSVGLQLMDDLFKENLQDKVDSTKNSLANLWRTMIVSYFNSIVKLFDRIYKSLVNFGKF